jgi:hypothetical protein
MNLEPIMTQNNPKHEVTPFPFGVHFEMIQPSTFASHPVSD